MNYSYFHLDVFTTKRLQGNPLAVFPEARGIPALQMQSIARELNLSETVFLSPSASDECITRARIFSPLKELDFAGHPTIGTACLLNEISDVPERFAIEENVGPVPIEVERGSDATRFWLTTPRVQFAETLPRAFAARLLGLDDADIAENPPQFLSAGSPLLFIQLRDRAAVDRASFQMGLLSEARGSLNSGGTFIFARKDGRSFDVYSRMFGPQIGIAEDPATGGATGPLAAYMRHYGMLPDHAVSHFTSEQGVKMGRRSELFVRLTHPHGDPVIQVGGNAVIVANGIFQIDDDIAVGEVK